MLPARDGVLRRDRVELIPELTVGGIARLDGAGEAQLLHKLVRDTHASVSKQTHGFASTSASSATARTNLYKLAGAGTLR